MSNQVQNSGARAATTTGRPAADQATPAPHVVPPVDVFEDESGITLLADLPGVSRERLGVRVDGDNLLIEGTAEVAGPGDMDIVYGEAQVPAFRREFTLSRELDASRIEAQLKDGVLRLSIPKAEAAKPRRIEVRVG
ncbi:Hsp20/alpha crystallin family protein [Ramlibacter sp. Leaf400]|uniref:Hsp20/alpha crystallin family protein n=1 Tax=Ramlibacter sp. Leaf400 TaxID=1736365 RepID=UPI0009E756E1|nr:Hsp20/alpha crystallin family protein [Ramlibacter sp. Leaf400]